MKKFLFMSMLCLTLIQPAFTNTVMANEVGVQDKFMEVDNTKGERKDIIEMRFRTYNGVNQYRRWNTTRNCWVDATWMNFN